MQMYTYTAGKSLNCTEGPMLYKYGQTKKVHHFVDHLLKEAFVARARRIESKFSPEGNAIILTVRNGMVLNKHFLTDYMPVLNRLKMISCLDIDVNHVPQRYEHVKIMIKIPNIHCISFMETFPVHHGESFILTLFYDESWRRYPKDRYQKPMNKYSYFLRYKLSRSFSRSSLRFKEIIYNLRPWYKRDL